VETFRIQNEKSGDTDPVITSLRPPLRYLFISVAPRAVLPLGKQKSLPSQPHFRRHLIKVDNSQTEESGGSARLTFKTVAGLTSLNSVTCKHRVLVRAILVPCLHGVACTGGNDQEDEYEDADHRVSGAV
jgi:hypothetical protein